MNPPLFRALAALLLATQVHAQQSGDANRDYTVNGVGSTAPSLISTTVAVPGAMDNAYQTMDPAAPVVWIASPTANPGQVSTGTNTVDIGTNPQFNDITYVLNGTLPGFPAAFYQTDATGRFDFDVTVNATFAQTSQYFCFAHFAATSPDGWWISQVHAVAFFPPQVLVEAVGPNSFNADVTQGFFRVTQFGNGFDIIDLTFDWMNTANPANVGQEFDCDQTGMSNNFIFGDGVSPDNGTYRNLSDLNTGLIYDALNSHIGFVSGLSTGGNCGFIGTNPVAVPSYKTLQFRFAPGVFFATIFELDIDTDGGGATGGNMDGLIISVTLSDSTILGGALSLDPADPNRSFLYL